MVRSVQARLCVQLQTEIALQLLRMGGFTLEKIAEITGMSLDDARTIAEKNAH